MSRLIDADALNEILKSSFQTENIRSGDNDGYFFQKGWNDAIRSILTSLEKIPTIEDSEPVRQGHWVAKPQMYRHPNAKNYYCSECREETAACGNFCPNCGCKMQGENNALY